MIDQIEQSKAGLFALTCSAPRNVYEACLVQVPEIGKRVKRGNGRQTGGRFVVVDDVGTCAQLAMEVAKGYHFDSAEWVYGSEALTEIRHEEPDLILLDLEMPSAGDSLVEILRRTMPWVNLAMWSSSSRLVAVGERLGIPTFHKRGSATELGVMLRSTAKTPAPWVQWQMSLLGFDVLKRHFEHGVGRGSDAELNVKGIVADARAARA